MSKTSENPFVGTWKLVSQHTHFPDGRIEASRGEGAIGVLMYDAAGNMAVQLARTDDHWDEYSDMRELTTAMDGYLGYFGTYEVDATTQTVTHRVRGSSFFGYRNSLQRRHYDFTDTDQTLTLMAASPRDGTKRVLIWQRATE